MTEFHALRNIMNVFMLMLFLTLLLQASKASGYNPLAELSSREDLVEMAGYGEDKLSSVLVTGTIICDACLYGKLQNLPVSGASMVVVCQTSGKMGKSALTYGITDEYGDFVIDLPSQLHAIPNIDKACEVQVLRLQKKSICKPSYSRKTKRITLSSVGNGIRAYTAGNIRLQHFTSKFSQVCLQKLYSTTEN